MTGTTGWPSASRSIVPTCERSRYRLLGSLADADDAVKDTWLPPSEPGSAQTAAPHGGLAVVHTPPALKGRHGPDQCEPTAPPEAAAGAATADSAVPYAPQTR